MLTRIYEGYSIIDHRLAMIHEKFAKPKQRLISLTIILVYFQSLFARACHYLLRQLLGVNIVNRFCQDAENNDEQVDRCV